jgi:hypothetical protein
MKTMRNVAGGWEPSQDEKMGSLRKLADLKLALYARRTGPMLTSNQQTVRANCPNGSCVVDSGSRCFARFAKKTSMQDNILSQQQKNDREFWLQ